MAIKVSGTTVVDDSRGLTNIATVDATTAAAISAAGVGGGGEHDFVASGAIETGDVVSLNADGTVSVISSNGPANANPSTLIEANNSDYLAATYDTLSNKVLIAYTNATNSNYGTAVVGTVSGTTISFGTPVVFNAASTFYVDVTFDSNSNKVVVSYVDGGNSNYGTSIVGEVSGTSINFGSPIVFYSALANYINTTFDSNSNKVVIAYSDSPNSDYGTAVVGTVSGTSISFGSAAVFASTLTYMPGDSAITFDSNLNKVVIAYYDGNNSFYGNAVVGTVSGTTISFGTPVVFNSDQTNGYGVAFDSNSNKVVIAHKAGQNETGFKVTVGTVSGTSISFGTPVVFSSTSIISNINVIFDSIANKVVIPFRDGGSSNYGYAVVGTVNGTTISLDTPVLIEQGQIGYITGIFDPFNNKTIIAYDNDSNSGYGTAVVFEAVTTNAPDYIGIAAENIADTATGAVTIDGGVASVPLDNYNLAIASYTTSSPSLQSVASSPRGLAFKADGTKMYVSSIDNFAVYQYSLSTAWDASTASYDSVSFSVLSETAYPMEIFFKPDGTEMYIASLFPSSVFQYTLSTAWNISSASFTGSVSAAVTMDAILKSDGTKMFTLSEATITSYTLSTAWDITSASSDALTLSVSSQDGDPRALFVTPDGLKLFVVGSSTDTVYRYSLPSSWNLSGASYDSVSFSVAAQDTLPFGLEFKTDGKIMYILGATGTVVDQYSTGTFGGFTINTSYFVADDGSFTTTNNGRKIGKAISATEIIVDSALTGDETNEYLGSLV